MLTKEENYRHAIYHCFATPHAYPHLDSLLQWWKAETYELASGTLTFALVQAARAADAERVWKLCQELPPRPFHCMLLSKLATFPAVEREVKDQLVRALQDPGISVGDLHYISKVDDPEFEDGLKDRSIPRIDLCARLRNGLQGEANGCRLA